MSRVRKAQTTELNKLLKNCSTKMESLTDSIQDLKDFQDCALQLDETIAKQAAINKQKLDDMDREFKDNKIKAVNSAAAELGKIVITKEELDELRSELVRVKESGRIEFSEQMSLERSRYEDKLSQAINIQTLKHEAESARLHANMDSHVKEVANLNTALTRMAEELKSQKDLTASVVGPRIQMSDRN